MHPAKACRRDLRHGRKPSVRRLRATLPAEAWPCEPPPRKRWTDHSPSWPERRQRRTPRRCSPSRPLGYQGIGTQARPAKAMDEPSRNVCDVKNACDAKIPAFATGGVKSACCRPFCRTQNRDFHVAQGRSCCAIHWKRLTTYACTLGIQLCAFSMATLLKDAHRTKKTSA